MVSQKCIIWRQLVPPIASYHCFLYRLTWGCRHTDRYRSYDIASHHMTLFQTARSQLPQFPISITTHHMMSLHMSPHIIWLHLGLCSCRAESYRLNHYNTSYDIYIIWDHTRAQHIFIIYHKKVFGTFIL